MGVSAAFAFWLMSAVLVLVPGADWAYVIAAGARGRAMWPAVSGILLGYVALTVIMAAGVAAVVARSPAVLTVLTVLGAAYLIRLGAGILRHPPAVTSTPAPAGHVLLRGLGVSGLNPKGLLLFLALLPQFTDPAGAWPEAFQIGLLGVLHTVNCGLGYLAVGALSRSLLRARPTATRITSRISGIAMVALGAVLLAEHWL